MEVVKKRNGRKSMNVKLMYERGRKKRGNMKKYEWSFVFNVLKNVVVIDCLLMFTASQSAVVTDIVSTTPPRHRPLTTHSRNR